MVKLRPAPATLQGTVSNEQKLGWGKTRHRFLSTVSSSHIQMNCITSLCYLFIIWRGKLLDISKCTYAPVVFLHQCPFSFFIQHKDNVMDGYITLAKYISIFFLLLYFSLYLKTGEKVGNDAHTGNMEASYPIQIEHWNDILGQYYLNFLRKKRKERIKKGKKRKEGIWSQMWWPCPSEMEVE